MPLHLPEGKTLAVSITADFDAHSLWMGTYGLTSPSYLSRGEFDAEVGVPRLLSLFGKYGVNATWFTPTHSMATFPDRFRSIVDAGHEIAAHGCYHESIPKLSADEERRLMERQLEQHQRFVGRKPRGYRSPAWDFTDVTLSLLEEFGFDWDSSLMGREFDAYHPRPVEVDWHEGNVFGPESPLLELPVSWYLDDFPVLEFVPGNNAGLGSTEVLFQRWKDQFDFALNRVPGGVYILTVHPQTIGRAHHLMMFERLIEYVSNSPAVWFASLSDVYDTWTDS